MGENIYLQDKQVADRYGVVRGTIWRWAKVNSKFPRPYSLSKGCKRWLLSELLAYEKKINTL